MSESNHAPSTTEVRRVDAVIVGAGFAGLYAHHELRRLGLTLQGFDAAADVGGTWWWNRYPGARCDILSVDYSYSFSPELDQEWDWEERYATQPEILRYADTVAQKFDLRRDIQFETSVVSAVWNDEAKRWLVTTDRGDRVDAQFVVMAVGCLSAAKQPEIDGIDSFDGPTYHTGQWPHVGVDFTGLRVGVIGTGSSAIQSIPLIAEQAAQLTVFQRTATYALPAKNAPLDPEWWNDQKARYPEYRELQRASRGGTVGPLPEHSALSVPPEERERRYQQGWESGSLGGVMGQFTDILLSEEANETAAEFIRSRIREIVDDPVVAERLSPRTFPFGTKRPCLDTGYYATYNRPNVTLVDLRETPITKITPSGVATTTGDHDFDALVFATGFDAMTGAFLRPDIRGVDGRTLRDKWSGGPRTYLGIASAGFPNLFTITGPGSPSVLTNMMASIEQHVEWVTDAIGYLRDHDLTAIDPTIEAEDGWVEHVNQVASFTLMPKANSWYMGANVPGKPQVFMPYVGGLIAFREVCDDVARNDYRGFTLS
jgi:cyclohexanone monooxygenase